MTSAVTFSEPSAKTSNSDRSRYALAGLSFPAERWQIIPWANDYGADAITLHDLHNLPRQSYRTISEAIDTIAERLPRA